MIVHVTKAIYISWEVLRHWAKSGWMWMMPRSENWDKDSQKCAHLLVSKHRTCKQIITTGMS